MYMSESDLLREYKIFITTKKGNEWVKFQKEKMNLDGDFGDYLYDFYPEMLQ